MGGSHWHSKPTDKQLGSVPRKLEATKSMTTLVQVIKCHFLHQICPSVQLEVTSKSRQYFVSTITTELSLLKPRITSIYI
jgi:hypothetical protein